MATTRLRAVLDTNVFLAAFLSRSSTSPARELLRQRWRAGEWTLLTSEVLVAELAEKLAARRLPEPDVEEFLSLLAEAAEWIEVAPDEVPDLLSDQDDNHVLACALKGGADFLVTHDRHLHALGEAWQGIRIVRTLSFLWAVRGDSPPGEASGAEPL